MTDQATGNEGGSAPPPGNEFLGQLPEELRGDPAFKDIKDLGGLAKSYVHAQRMVGMDKVAIPGKDAKPEDWRAFYSRLGAPEAPDKYEFPQYEPKTEGFTIDPEMQTQFAQQAHELGLSKAQAAKLFDWYAQSSDGIAQQALENDMRFQQEAKTQLAKEWGNAYDQNVNFARAAAKEYGGEELINVLEETRLGDHPVILKALAKIGRALAEDPMHTSQSGQNFEMAPAEAQAKIAEKKGDKEFMAAYTDQSHPRHKYAVEEMSRLYQAANPEIAA